MINMPLIRPYVWAGKYVRRGGRLTSHNFKVLKETSPCLISDSQGCVKVRFFEGAKVFLEKENCWQFCWIKWPLQWLSDLQLGDKKVTNWIIYIVIYWFQIFPCFVHLKSYQNTQNLPPPPKTKKTQQPFPPCCHIKKWAVVGISVHHHSRTAKRTGTNPHPGRFFPFFQGNPSGAPPQSYVSPKK